MVGSVNRSTRTNRKGEEGKSPIETLIAAELLQLYGESNEITFTTGCRSSYDDHFHWL